MFISEWAVFSVMRALLLQDMYHCMLSNHCQTTILEVRSKPSSCNHRGSWPTKSAWPDDHGIPIVTSQWQTKPIASPAYTVCSTQPDSSGVDSKPVVVQPSREPTSNVEVNGSERLIEELDSKRMPARRPSLLIKLAMPRRTSEE